MAAAIRTELPLLDGLLDRYRPALGGDFDAYRNHCLRVVNFCLAAAGSSDPQAADKAQIAAAFHDLGIWTHGSFDYLGPSEQLAREYLAEAGLGEWSEEVAAMVREHHRIRPWPGSALVEAFRCADWCDVTLGLLRLELPRDFVREVLQAFPNAGFHRRLLQLGLRQLLKNPLKPLPMLRW